MTNEEFNRFSLDTNVIVAGDLTASMISLIIRAETKPEFRKNMEELIDMLKRTVDSIDRNLTELSINTKAND